jgi:hypothetical protein
MLIEVNREKKSNGHLSFARIRYKSQGLPVTTQQHPRKKKFNSVLSVG